MSSSADHVLVSYAEFVERRARLHRVDGTVPDGDPSGVEATTEAPAADVQVCTTGTEPGAATAVVPLVNGK